MVVHEIEHGFGLKHYSNLGSIMYPTERSEMVSVPQSIDRIGLTNKY